MREFHKADGLPFDLARWQPTVDAMLDGIDTSGPIFIMIDQGMVRAGQPHRRHGLHIDGYWSPELQAHRGGGGHVSAHINAPPSRQGHRSTPPSSPGNHITWADAPFDEPEAILLASSISAARGFIGEFDGCKDKGDCGHVSTAGMIEVPMHASLVYAGNVTMLHESLPVDASCLRTLVRLNVPGWSPA